MEISFLTLSNRVIYLYNTSKNVVYLDSLLHFLLNKNVAFFPVVSNCHLMKLLLVCVSSQLSNLQLCHFSYFLNVLLCDGALFYLLFARYNMA